MTSQVKLNGDVNLANRFHVTVDLFSNRSQMTSKFVKNEKSCTRGAAECVTDDFLLNFVVFCDLLLYRPKGR